MTNLYFAYGSNLNPADWQRWCKENGHRADNLKPLFTAWLPDRELRFTRYSKGRKGGVLDVVPQLGKLVPGVVFEVTGDGWNALDEKEGTLHGAYRRIETECLTADGQFHPVAVYEVNPERREPYVAPNSEYVEVVCQGLQKFGLDDGPLNAACANTASPDLVGAIFVYGTLLRGECRHHLLEDFRPECILLSEARGRLLDFGEYPGLALNGAEDRCVSGEFVRTNRIVELLEKLDRVEGFHGYGQQGSLFRRALIEVGMCDGRVRLAWVYLAGGTEESVAEIPSGNWRASRGRWNGILDEIVRGHLGTLNERELAGRVIDSRCFGGTEQDITDLVPLAAALDRRAVSERQLAQASGKWAVGFRDGFVGVSKQI